MLVRRGCKVRIFQYGGRVEDLSAQLLSITYIHVGFGEHATAIHI